MSKKKYPEGHFIGQWIGIGSGIGLALGVPMGAAMGNPGMFSIGLPIGIGIGVAIGSAKENEAKAKGLIRPLTKKEQKRKKYSTFAGIGAVTIGLIVLLLFFFLI